MIPDTVCRPLHTWPRPTYTDRRRRSPFRTSWTRTCNQLADELRRLQARDRVLEVDLDEADLRLDGWPRAHARVPPPVKLSATTTHGPIVVATDRFDFWQDNVRAIALGLEALRLIDRYGITDDGQQYAGWKALPAGDPTDDDRDRAWAILADWAGLDIPTTKEHPFGARRRALARAHPDRGGDVQAFAAVQAALQTLNLK